MTYDYMVKQDGQFYKPGQEVPDMGTLVCTSAQGIYVVMRDLLRMLTNYPRMLQQAALFWQVILAITTNLKSQQQHGTRFKE